MPISSAGDFVRQKRILMTAKEDAAIEALIVRLADDAETTLKFSHSQRAAVMLLHHVEPQLRKLMQQARLVRPPNDCPTAIRRFECQIADLLLAAFHQAEPTLEAQFHRQLAETRRNGRARPRA